MAVFFFLLIELILVGGFPSLIFLFYLAFIFSDEAAFNYESFVIFDLKFVFIYIFKSLLLFLETDVGRN